MSDPADSATPAMSAGAAGSAAMQGANAPASLRLRQCRYGMMLYRLNDTFIGRSLDLYGEMGENEVRVLCGLVSPGDVVLEIGSNIGTNVVPRARCVGPLGSVIAFEPQRQVHQMLCANVALNGLGNVITLGGRPARRLDRSACHRSTTTRRAIRRRVAVDRQFGRARAGDDDQRAGD